jgi:subtilase family serine protease
VPGKLQCGVYKPTNVISASYGQAESDLPMKYTQRQCNEFLKLGLQGHSILFASGDYGVASFPTDEHSINGCLGPEGTIFSPQYPSNCPYVTSVGGTMLYNDQTVQNAESVMQVDLGGTAVNFSSSGGFSNYFSRPWYQEQAVEHYFAVANPKYPYYSGINVDTNTTKGLYNRIGRAYPDVSANGAYFPAYNQAHLVHFFGASLASPIFASVLTLVCLRSVWRKGGFMYVANTRPDQRGTPVHRQGTGWIHQPGVVCQSLGAERHHQRNESGLWYRGIPRRGGVSAYFFFLPFHASDHPLTASTRWDPATGLGTPNFPKMLELFLALP